MNTLENSSIKMERSAIDLFLRLTDLDLSKMMRVTEIGPLWTKSTANHGKRSRRISS